MFYLMIFILTFQFDNIYVIPFFLVSSLEPSTTRLILKPSEPLGKLTYLCYLNLSKFQYLCYIFWIQI